MLKQMLLAIAQHGLTQTQISERTGIPQPTISRLASGKQKDISYTQGKQIERLWEELTKTTPDM